VTGRCCAFTKIRGGQRKLDGGDFRKDKSDAENGGLPRGGILDRIKRYSGNRTSGSMYCIDLFSLRSDDETVP